MTLTYQAAIAKAMRDSMAEDKRIFVMGQDVGRYSILGITAGLAESFGLDRVRDCPISESAMVGIGVGAAMKGYTAVIELAYADIAAVAFSSIVHSAAKIHYSSNGQLRCPLIVRAPIGRWSRHGPMGTEITASWYYNVPDINIAMPASCNEIYWGFRRLLQSPYPTIFLEDKSLYSLHGEIDENFDPMRAHVVRPGDDLMVFAAGRTVGLAVKAADELAAERGGNPVEVVSLGMVKPLDTETVLERAGRAKRVLVVQDEPENGGYGPHIQSLICNAGVALARPPQLLARPDRFLPYNREEDHLPTQDHVKRALVDLLSVS